MVITVVVIVIMAAITVAIMAAGKLAGELKSTRQPKGWRVFRCTDGRKL